MKLLFNLCFFLTFFSSIVAFDVRVLLEKYQINDDEIAECILSSPHGIIVSGIDEPIQGRVSILCRENDVSVNGILLTDEWIRLSPALSTNHKKKLDQFVTHWLKIEHDICKQNFIDLADFYEKFVLDRNLRDFSPLYATMQHCINICIQSFIEPIEHPSISYESLVEIAEQELHNNLKQLFISAITEQNISKSVRKQLQNSDKVRVDFFVKILEQVLSEFLKAYFLQLPHKIILQAIQEDACCISFNKNKYVGTFYLVRKNKDILLINALDIDDYLLSVVFSEGWPGWPMEVNKALVIANRTYLAEKILQANKSKRPYHIVNTIKHQTYKGHHKFIKLKQAVDETRNIVVVHNGEPIEAMFDSCCGGVIPAKIEGLNTKKHPYLARTKACTYCKKSWIYSWKAELSKLEITEILRKDHPDLQEVKDIKITERDAAGLVKQVLVTTRNKSFYVSGKKMYSLFPLIKSYCYTIKKKGKGYLFQGRGYGHHMGLCQWGSLGMVQDNWSYKNILQFYYPGTDFMKLSLSR